MRLVRTVFSTPPRSPLINLVVAEYEFDTPPGTDSIRIYLEKKGRSQYNTFSLMSFMSCERSGRGENTQGECGWEFCPEGGQKDRHQDGART